MTLAIALPKGNHIEGEVIRLLADCGVSISRSHPRSIRATVEGLAGISEAIFCRPAQIIDLLVNNAAAIGICGKDTILEYGSHLVDILKDLPTSTQTHAALFTHEDNPVSTMEDFIADGTPIVFSEYPDQTRIFLEKYGYYPRIVGCKSAETFVCGIRECKYGVALVETGTTLRVNGLKEIHGGIIFESCAVLVNRAGTSRHNLSSISDQIS